MLTAQPFATLPSMKTSQLPLFALVDMRMTIWWVPVASPNQFVKALLAWVW